MKKILISSFALFPFMFCNAQVKTQSNYDVDGNGEITLTDVTSTVNRLLSDSIDDRTLVDGESLNKLLQTILTKLDRLDSIECRLKKIEEKLVNTTPDDTPIPDEPQPVDPFNGHEYIDLGLTSGLKWATCNIGANKPEDYGNIYAWAETSAYGEAPSAYPVDYTKAANSTYSGQSTKTEYNWSHYKYMNNGFSDWKGCSKYTIEDGETYGSWYDNDTFIGDSKAVLDLDDDAANMNFGEAWRMPTDEDFEELRKECYWQWTNSYNDSSIKGYIVYKIKNSADKGKVTFSTNNYTPADSYALSDTHIFLPAAGSRNNSSISNVGSNGYYWSSSLFSMDSYHARYLYFNSVNVSCNTGFRYYGYSVRPVSQYTSENSSTDME